ncbi:hypothetical protein HC928_03570 [bacterium]|nr:hypothetical protein [bacterium]
MLAALVIAVAHRGVPLLIAEIQALLDRLLFWRNAHDECNPQPRWFPDHAHRQRDDPGVDPGLRRQARLLVAARRETLRQVHLSPLPAL